MIEVIREVGPRVDMRLGIDTSTSRYRSSLDGRLTWLTTVPKATLCCMLTSLTRAMGWASGLTSGMREGGRMGGSARIAVGMRCDV